MSTIEHDTQTSLEMCACGHVRKDHANGEHERFTKALSELFAFGHGECRYAFGSCSCKKFTWVSKFKLRKTVSNKGDAS